MPEGSCSEAEPGDPDYPGQQGRGDAWPQPGRDLLSHRAPPQHPAPDPAQTDTAPGRPGLQRGVRHHLLAAQGGQVQGLGEDLQDGCEEQSVHCDLSTRDAHEKKSEVFKEEKSKSFKNEMKSQISVLFPAAVQAEQ